MADKKISQFPVATTISAVDIVPIVSGAVNKIVTIGVICLNLPNIGNTGITKNTVNNVVSTAIPLTKTIITIDGNIVPYTLGAGADGQEVVIVALGDCTVLPINADFTSIGMASGSSIVLMYIGSLAKWVPKSYHNVVLI
jgi:hypothetical protein